MFEYSLIPHSKLSGYAKADYEVIDYQMWKFNDMYYHLRGPRPENLEPGSYVVCLGAAQTFGRFTPNPYPKLLEMSLGVPVLNLGFAGVGIEFYLNSKLLQLINNAALVVVQATSGRSLSTSVFDCPDGGGTLSRRNGGENEKPIFALEAWRSWMAEIEEQNGGRNDISKQVILELVNESRAIWVAQMIQLREAIKPKCIFFWFSKRSPKYEIHFGAPELVFGEFPQLIDEGCFKAADQIFDGTAICVTDRGSPQPLISRFTGRPHILNPAFKHPTSNAYYPSPEMHEDAASALEPIIRSLI
jgi:hypothetical protein